MDWKLRGVPGFQLVIHCRGVPFSQKHCFKAFQEYLRIINMISCRMFPVNNSMNIQVTQSIGKRDLQTWTSQNWLFYYIIIYVHLSSNVLFDIYPQKDSTVCFTHYILGLDLYVSIFLGGSHIVLHTWDARWRLRGRKIRQKFGACWRRDWREGDGILTLKRFKKMGSVMLGPVKGSSWNYCQFKEEKWKCNGGTWSTMISQRFVGCVRFSGDVSYVPCNKDMGGSCLFNQTKWSKMSMALFGLTRQWQDRKAMLEGLKRKFQRVALKRWVAFGHVWFFSAPFAGSGSDRTNATTSRASRTARYDGRGDLSKRLSSAGRWSPASGIRSCWRTMGPPARITQINHLHAVCRCRKYVRYFCRALVRSFQVPGKIWRRPHLKGSQAWPSLAMFWMSPLAIKHGNEKLMRTKQLMSWFI